MRVEFAPSTGCPHGQFVIYADNDSERAILGQFVNAQSSKWLFWQHGHGFTHSFNFGFIRRPWFDRFAWLVNAKYHAARVWWNTPVSGYRD